MKTNNTVAHEEYRGRSEIDPSGLLPFLGSTPVKIILCLGILLLGGGCLSLTRAQLEGKLPKVDGDLSVEASTIYGVSGSLVETGVKWEGDKKKVKTSEVRVTSPLGSYKRTIKGTVDAGR